MADDSREIARFAPPRIPFPPAVLDRFQVDQAGWRALIDAVWPGAPNAEAVVLALSYCRARKLDPFKRPVHIVSVWSREQKRMIASVWPGIGELRTTAFRTGLYAGREATEWGPDRELGFDGHTITYPEWAQVTVHRLDKHGNPRPYPGPRVYWLESYATAGRDTIAPNEMWRRRVRGQLDKCAEAAALRAAFPEEIGNDYTSEEMEGQVVDHAPAEPAAAPAPPLRGNEALRSRLAPSEAGHARSDGPAEAAPAPFEVEPEVEAAPFRIVELEPDQDEPSEAGHARSDGPSAPRRRRRRQAEEPSDAEIERSQDAIAAVLGPEEVEALDNPAPPVVIKPTRLKGDRGWDWPTYADELIAAALRTPIADLGRLRGANSSMFDVLRASDREQWERVNTALADYEREGVPG